MHFTEHGIFDVSIEGNTLLVDATGPFNEQLVIRYEKAIEACIKQIEGATWNQIITLRQLSIFTPEAEEMLTQTLIDRRSRGLHTSIVVLLEVEAESLIKLQMGRCYKRAGVKFEFTQSTHHARKLINATYLSAG